MQKKLLFFASGIGKRSISVQKVINQAKSAIIAKCNKAKIPQVCFHSSLESAGSPHLTQFQILVLQINHGFKILLDNGNF